MTREERLQFCKVCPHRQMSWEKGLICKFTGQPADFEGECPNFQKDEKEIEAIAEKKKEVEKSTSERGFLAFFIYVLLPASALLTVIRFVRGFNADDYISSPFFLLCDVVFMLFYLYFIGYTMYAFDRRKPDAVFFAKYVLIMAFVSKVIYLISAAFVDETDLVYPASTMAISLIWNVALYIYLCVSEQVNDRIPKETRRVGGTNKVLFILSIVLPVLLFVAGFIQIYSRAASAAKPENYIEEVCRQSRSELPRRVSDDLMATDVRFDGESLIYDYRFDSTKRSDYSEDHLELLALLGKENTWADLPSMKQDEIYGILNEGGFGMKWHYSDEDGVDMYTVAFSGEELSGDVSSHKTSQQTFSRILNLFNNSLPMEYIGGSQLRKTYLSDDGQTIHYDIMITGLDRQALAGITKSYLTDYMKETLLYIYDAPMQLARLNSMNVSFDFTADCSDIWSESVLFTSDELGVAKE